MYIISDTYPQIIRKDTCTSYAINRIYVSNNTFNQITRFIYTTKVFFYILFHVSYPKHSGCGIVFDLPKEFRVEWYSLHFQYVYGDRLLLNFADLV